MNSTKDILSQIGNEKIVPVALIIRDKYILTGLRHYTPDKWKKISVWTLPGGRCDKNETIETTLRREVKEEIGINDLKIIDFLGKFKGAKKGDIVYVFLAEINQEPQLLEPEKFSEWKWCLISKIPSNFINKSVLKLIQTKFLIRSTS